MATTNIVPRANNEGSIGTSDKQWNDIYAKDFHVNGDSLKDILDDLAARNDGYTKDETDTLLDNNLKLPILVKSLEDLGISGNCTLNDVLIAMVAKREANAWLGIIQQGTLTSGITDLPGGYGMLYLTAFSDYRYHVRYICGAGNNVYELVDNVNIANKNASNLVRLLPQNSPALYGTPTTTTAETTDSSTRIANTAYVQNNLVNYLPSATHYQINVGAGATITIDYSAYKNCSVQYNRGIASYGHILFDDWSGTSYIGQSSSAKPTVSCSNHIISFTNNHSAALSLMIDLYK